MSSEALIVDAVQSPIGKRNGTLASLRADELAGQVLDALVQRFDLDPGAIEDVEMGCVTQVGEQAINIARICNGAAALLLASERSADELGLTPRGRFVSFGLAGVDPYRMLHGNPIAMARALELARRPCP
jgi:acetyl-CoA acetyltransferase